MPRFLCAALISAASLLGQAGGAFRTVTILPAPDRSDTGVIDFQSTGSVRKARIKGTNAGTVQFIDDTTHVIANIDTANRVANINGTAAQAALNVNSGYIYTDGGLVTNVASWQAVNSNTDGALLRGYHVGQNVAGTKGGYMSFAPVLYNPYNSGSVCYDEWGNIVTQPLPLPGLSNFGTHDTIMWVSTSPTMPEDNHCGATLPVELDYGLNINSYFFARGGLATDLDFFNAIHSLRGGVTAVSFTAGRLYSAGTVTTTGTLAVPTYLGGYINVGHSVGPPASGTIATVTNPLTRYGGINAGTIYFDDGLGCLNVYNGSSWTCASGPGAAGSNTQVQFNNSGSFGASSNFTWNNTSKLLEITTLSSGVPGITVQNGYVQADGGFLASSGVATNYNAIQAPTGGMYAHSFTALNYIQTGHGSSAPTATTGDTLHAGAMYWDDSSGAEKVYNGSAWVSLSGGTVAGSDTQVQFNNAGAFGASSNLTWNNGSRVLTVSAASSGAAGIAVGTGYVQADAGFLATAGTATNYNAVQAPGGGMYAKSFTALDYVQAGHSAGAPTLTTGDSFHAGALYYDDTAAALKVYTGSVWTNVGVGLFVPPDHGLTDLGDATHNFRWVYARGIGSDLAAPFIVWTHSAQPLYFQTNSTNHWQIESAGNLLPVSGESIGSTSARVAKVWTTDFDCSGSGCGVRTLNTLAGALTLAGTANQVNVSSFGTTVTLSTPQSIATTSPVTFASVTTGAGGAFNSGATGGSIAFQTSNFNLQMDGNGNISAAGSVNLTTGSAAYKMLGGTVINSSGAFVGNGVQVGRYNGIAGRAFNPWDAFGTQWTGQDYTIGFNAGTNKLTVNGIDVSGLKFIGGSLVSYIP